MKKFIPLLALALCASCSGFLDENPSSFVDRDSYFKTDVQCRTAVNSCYEGLRAIYVTTLFTHLEATTDLAIVPSSADVNAILDINPSQCNISKTIWSNGYKAVMYCNAAIAGVAASSIDEGAKKDLLAEAKTMRAFWYWLLTSVFGDVPFYTEDVVDQPIMDRIAKLGRMSANATRAAMIKELQECYSYDAEGNYTGALSEMRPNDNAEKGRAGWAMGMILIGKMALWNAYTDTASGTDWFGVAADALEKLVPVFGALAQYPLSDLCFRVDDAPERIFEIRHAYSEGTLSYAGNLAQNCMPGYNTSTKLYDGIKVPLLGTRAKVSACNRPTSYFYSALQPDDGTDARVDINQGRRYEGTPFVNGINRPWMGQKFWCPNMKTTYDSNDYPVFRYADALLMLAECCCAKKDKDGFERYLNEVRSRAGLPAYSVGNWVRAEQELRDERARELFGEFQRKFDLVRWGIWYTALKEYWETEMASLGFVTKMQPCHRYLPIPVEQVVNSGFALDNKEYNEYGL